MGQDSSRSSLTPPVTWTNPPSAAAAAAAASTPRESKQPLVVAFWSAPNSDDFFYDFWSQCRFPLTLEQKSAHWAVLVDHAWDWIQCHHPDMAPLEHRLLYQSWKKRRSSQRTNRLSIAMTIGHLLRYHQEWLDHPDCKEDETHILRLLTQSPFQTHLLKLPDWHLARRLATAPIQQHFVWDTTVMHCIDMLPATHPRLGTPSLLVPNVFVLLIRCQEGESRTFSKWCHTIIRHLETFPVKSIHILTIFLKSQPGLFIRHTSQPVPRVMAQLCRSMYFRFCKIPAVRSQKFFGAVHSRNFQTQGLLTELQGGTASL